MSESRKANQPKAENAELADGQLNSVTGGAVAQPAPTPPLKIEGIAGESQDTTHKSTIE